MLSHFLVYNRPAADSNLPILLGYRFSFSFCYVLLIVGSANLFFSFIHLQYFNN